MWLLIPLTFFFFAEWIFYNRTFYLISVEGNFECNENVALKNMHDFETFLNSAEKNIFYGWVFPES